MTTLPNDNPHIFSDHTKVAAAPARATDELNTTICEIFAAQVLEHSSAIAVACEGRQLSYAELDRRSSQLAHYLIELGMRPEARVGVSMERGLDLIVGLLGILKAGAAYVPLDPQYPQERL